MPWRHHNTEIRLGSVDCVPLFAISDDTAIPAASPRRPALRSRRGRQLSPQRTRPDAVDEYERPVEPLTVGVEPERIGQIGTAGPQRHPSLSRLDRVRARWVGLKLNSYLPIQSDC